MNKEQSLRVLILLSRLEGYITDKLPDYIYEELTEVCVMLDKNIKEN